MSEIYAFHQGRGDNGQLWYNVPFDGETDKWLGDKKVPKSGITGDPSAVVYNGKTYVFYRGKGDSGWLWYNVFDGDGWEGDKEVRETGLTAGRPRRCGI